MQAPRAAYEIIGNGLNANAHSEKVYRGGAIRPRVDE